MSERGANFVDNQAYFKRNTSHSGTFAPRSEQISYTGRTPSQTGRTPSQTGRNPAQTGRTIAITSNPAQTGRTQRIPSGEFNAMRSQKLPKATNTVAIDDEKIALDLKQSKWLTILLWTIGALLIIIAVSFIIWLSIEPSNMELPTHTQQVKVETQWNTNHTAKF